MEHVGCHTFSCDLSVCAVRARLSMLSWRRRWTWKAQLPSSVLPLRVSGEGGMLYSVCLGVDRFELLTSGMSGTFPDLSGFVNIHITVLPYEANRLAAGTRLCHDGTATSSATGPVPFLSLQRDLSHELTISGCLYISGVSPETRSSRC